MTRKRIRMLEWLLATVLLFALVHRLAPQEAPVLVLKAFMVVAMGTLAYWFDRSVSPYARPDNPDLTPIERSAAGLRRAIIIGAAMIAGSLGA